MKECDNIKIHISNNFILSISLLIMFDTLLLRPSLHCNTPLHFTILHYTYRHMETAGPSETAVPTHKTTWCRACTCVYALIIFNECARASLSVYVCVYACVCVCVRVYIG
jgi:hypothetical protein